MTKTGGRYAGFLAIADKNHPACSCNEIHTLSDGIYR